MEQIYHYYDWVYYFERDHYEVPIDDTVASFDTEEEVENFIDNYIERD